MAHFTKSTSSSQARARGVPIAEILKVANWSSRSTFEHFYYRSENKVHKGRMDCMRRWKIQGTVQSHPYVCSFILPSLSTILWKPQWKRLEVWRSEYIVLELDIDLSVIVYMS